MKLLSLFILLVTLGSATEKEIIKPEPPARVRVAPEAALKVRDAQVEWLQINQEVERLTYQRERAAERLDKAVNEMWDGAKVKKGEYQLDDKSWEFVRQEKK